MDFNTRLIKLVKPCKFLYDLSDPKHGDQAHRDKAWKEIAAALDVQKSECKKSWILLREGYRRTLKKHIASKLDTTYKKDRPIPKWVYEDEMAFLAPHLKHKELTLSTLYKDINVEENSNNADNHTNQDAAEQRPAKRSRTHEASRRTCANEAYSNTLIKYILEKTTKKNDVQNFFESISSTVQSFPPHDRAVAKARVFEVISQMELEILSRESTSSYQDGSSPASYEAEAVRPQTHVFVSPSPEARSPSLLEVEMNNSSDEEVEIKKEPEEGVGLQFEQDT
ncbi:hypothetical protein PYW08_012460 [Mythimna loreyi]|uniref:Uncharacterized protein n=1 Tax=Mythimna loreyi TaxID=667449 RepID=A0ACC2Q252_9NEOP|nr:hypothetical protein PYW08_012460 [Mythimna loreyi]